MPKENAYQQPDLLSGAKKRIAFDIEIAKDLPDDFDDFKAYRPLGISCAAALTEGGSLTLWYGGKGEDAHNRQMTAAEVVRMVDFLWEKVQAGYQIYTWNGLGFDFDILFEESGGDVRCRQLAEKHVDMMFHFFCIKGYAISLDKAARGMGLKGKTEGMSGALAPKLWREGQYETVLDYVAQDVRATMALARECDKQKLVRWTSNRGRPQICRLPNGWLTADLAQNLPEPDTSWMSTPWPRSKFTGWLR